MWPRFVQILFGRFSESSDTLMYIKRTVHSVLFLVIPLGIAFHSFEKGNICFTRNSFFQQGLRLAAALEYQQSYSVTKMR